MPAPPADAVPEGLAASGLALWEAIEGRFVLEPHERLLLEQAARTADLITTMQAEVDHDGVQLPWGQDGQVPGLTRRSASLRNTEPCWPGPSPPSIYRRLTPTPSVRLVTAGPFPWLLRRTRTRVTPAT